MSQAELESMARTQILEKLTEYLKSEFETDVLPVSSNAIMMPIVDAEGNEKYATITVQIPRGTRTNGTYIPYNGYEVAKEYEYVVQENEAKVQARQAAQNAREKERERKAALRKKELENKRALLEQRKARLAELRAQEGDK